MMFLNKFIIITAPLQQVILYLNLPNQNPAIKHITVILEFITIIQAMVAIRFPVKELIDFYYEYIIVINFIIVKYFIVHHLIDDLLHAITIKNH